MLKLKETIDLDVLEKYEDGARIISTERFYKDAVVDVEILEEYRDCYYIKFNGDGAITLIPKEIVEFV